MTCLALTMAAAFGAFFEVQTIPLEPSAEPHRPAQARTFFANADSDAIADLFIVQGSTITTVTTATGIRQTVLPQGISAFDVADTDGDGTYEIIAVQGRSVLRLPLALQGDTPKPTTLFDADSLYELAIPSPVPTVLVVTVAGSGHTGIALPTNGGIETHALDGTVIANHVYAKSTSKQFDGAWLSDRDKGTLTLSAFTSSDYVTAQDDPSKPAGPIVGEDQFRARSGRTNSTMSLRAAINYEPVNWPWFVVKPDKSKTTRAYCAVEESLNTLIRMADVASDADGMPASIAKPGPERRYPGAMIPVGDTAPDFNGDGYADLPLWNAPRPGISVDALLRAVVGRNWPMTLTVHLYSPDKGRFEPMPATDVVYRVPVTWFLTGGVPLRHYVLGDFNGDKKTDLAMCTSENEYSIWLYSDGFAATPDETHTFSENITGVELTGDVAGNGKTSIVLRSDSHIYALYAK